MLFVGLWKCCCRTRSWIFTGLLSKLRGTNNSEGDPTEGARLR